MIFFRSRVEQLDTRIFTITHNMSDRLRDQEEARDGGG